MLNNQTRYIPRVLLVVVLLVSSGCAVLEITDTLPRAILNQDDPQVIRDGAPTFLIIMDALVEADSEDSDYLMLASQLYGTYASAFAGEDEVRSKKLAQRAFDYGRRSLCLELAQLCANIDGSFDDFNNALPRTSDEEELNQLFGFSRAWATWLQANSSDWSAIAQLPKIKALIQYILRIDEGHGQGAAHLYMGVLESQLPPALGGKPELARMHFERAIALSGQRNLFAKVLFAESYARLIYERELHDRLLNEVIVANPYTDKLTLINTLAQERAHKLLAESEAYFE